MTGERFLWFELADRLHMPLQKCQQETLSSEFVEWQIFYELKADRERDFHAKWEWYFAEFLKLFKQANFQNMEHVTTEEQLMEFKAAEQKGKEEPLTEEQMLEKAKLSEAMWCAWLGIDRSKR